MVYQHAPSVGYNLTDPCAAEYRVKFNLLTKGIILVSIPLCFEITLFGILLNLQNQLEQETQRVTHSKRINDSINSITQKMVEIGRAGRDYGKISTAGQYVRKRMNFLRQDFITLKQLVQDDPKKLEAVQFSEQKFNAVQEELRQLGMRMRTARIDEVNDIVTDARKRLNAEIDGIVSSGLLKIAEDTRLESEADKSSTMREQIRNVLKLALSFSVGLAILGAVWFSKSISGGLNKLKDNATRLARGEKLTPMLGGEDEIAELDQTFHLASDLINAAIQKEQAILKNAKDVILSVDENLTIVSVNPAGVAVFEREFDDLLGKRFVSLLKEKSVQEAVEFFKQVKIDGVERDLEVSIKTPSEKELTMSMSGSYSQSEKTFFFVLHDVSASKELELIRREVTAMVTHDLKTPLQTINTYFQLLSSGKLGDLNKRGNDLLGFATHSSERMKCIIDSVLDLEKIRSGNAPLKLEAVEVADLLRSSADTVSLLAGSKEISIEVCPLEKPLSIEGDKHWLQQVLVNLMANAINYSPEKTSVSLICKEINSDNSNFAEIQVCDEGPGIPDAQKPLVFERFHRLESTAKQVAGSGLGLTFCKEMVQLHNGFIRVEDNETRGTKFVVGIPLSNGKS